MRVGAMEIVPVLDGEAWARPTHAFVGTTEADWEPHRALLNEKGMLPMTMGGLLIRGRQDGRVVLVDAGIGHFEMFGRRVGGKLLESLAAYGVRPEEITDVIFSHLHLDHVGWASDAGKPVFPNAAYRCDQREWDFWITGPEEAMTGVSPDFIASQKEVLAPVADRLTTWSADGMLLPGLNVLHAPGHTPGSAVLVVSDGAERALLLGDVVHCPVELIDEEWGSLGDVDPVLARRTRNALAREYEGKDIPMTAAHFPGLAFGRLLKGEGRRRWVV